MLKTGIIVSSAVGLFIAGTLFCNPIGKESYQETYYSPEPLTYESSLIRTKQVSKWIFWDATEVQYTIKNTDTADGDFTLNFIFSNGNDTKSTTSKVKILAGTQEAVAAVSPFGGVSNGILNVAPPNKLVAHTRTKTRDIYIWDHLGSLMSILSSK